MAALRSHPRLRFSALLIAFIASCEFCLGSASAVAQEQHERDVAITARELTLRGTLVLPAGDHPVIGVLLLPGSGPTDRDGNQPKLHNDTLRQLAIGLVKSDFASLRADKRGVGRSIVAGMHEQDLRFDDYVDDAVRWIEFLRVQPRIRSVFIAGHSEGALVAVLAAQRTAVDGVVSIAGPGLPFGAVLRQQIAASNWPSPLRIVANHIIDELEAGRGVRDVPSELSALFRPSVQPYLMSQFAYDPAFEIAKLDTRVLILQGDRDLQILAADAKRLAAAARRGDLVLLPGVNHVLRDAPLDRNGNLALYAMPDQPLATGVLSSIAQFVRPSAQ